MKKNGKRQKTIIKKRTTPFILVTESEKEVGLPNLSKPLI